MFFSAKNRTWFSNAFVSKPFIKYKHIHEQANKHINITYHKNTPRDSNINKAVEANRKMLRCIASTVLFCGTHDLALRGKNNNEGNFNDLLKFRIEAVDSRLAEHFKNCSKNGSPLLFEIFDPKHGHVEFLQNLCDDVPLGYRIFYHHLLLTFDRG